MSLFGTSIMRSTWKSGSYGQTVKCVYWCSTLQLCIIVLLHIQILCHLAQVWRRNTKSIPTAGMLREALDYNILWQGDPFSCSKTFGKLTCKLCQKERVALLRHSWMDEANMLNDRNEIHGSCRHRARFHRLTLKRSGTDDPS